MKELLANEYTSFCKRLQSALKHRGVSCTLTEIKESCLTLVESYGNELTGEVQHNCLDLLLRKYQPNALVEPQSVLTSPVEETASIALSEREKHELVATKARELDITISTADISFVAEQVNSTDRTLDEVINQVEIALLTFANHKKQEGLNKINEMFGRVYSEVQDNNRETSQALTNGLRQFGRDLKESQEDFKSNVLSALSCFKVPTA
jgi:hypothetical protein